MGFFDKLLQGVDVAGLGYTLGSEIAKLDPFGFNVDPFLPPRAGGTGQPGAGGTTAGAGGISSGVAGGGFSAGAGATGDWGDLSMNGYSGGGFPLTTTNGGRRGLIPYSGGIIPSGYRVGMRKPRAPTAGYPGGAYLIPRRSMNPLNPRALMRAERRLNAFSKWVKRHFVIASHAPKRRKGGRFTKRRK
jgi:hypothetical protein